MKSKTSQGGSLYWIYMLECTNGAYYTGITVDMQRRYLQHLSGKGGAKFTRAFKPLRIAQCWKMTGSRGEAQRLEYALKSLDRNRKEELVDEPKLLKKLLKDIPGSKKIRTASIPEIKVEVSS